MHGFAQDQANWVKLEMQFLPVIRLQPTMSHFQLAAEVSSCIRGLHDACANSSVVDFLLPCRCIVMVRCTSVVAEGRRRWMICPYLSFRLMNGSWQRDVKCIWWYYIHAAVPRLERPALVSCEWSDITRFFLGSMHRLTHRLGKKGFMDSDG